MKLIFDENNNSLTGLYLKILALLKYCLVYITANTKTDISVLIFDTVCILSENLKL